MRIDADFPTIFGLHAMPRRPMISVLLTPHESYALIRDIERKAAEAERDGHTEAADLLLCRAAALREAAR
jgi:hypothetical protein